MADIDIATVVSVPEAIIGVKVSLYGQSQRKWMVTVIIPEMPIQSLGCHKFSIGC